MKIGLSEEYIKKGSELVDDYEYRGFDDYIYDMELGLYNGTYDVIISYSPGPLYKHFLQLVIEAINKTEWTIVQGSETIECTNNYDIYTIINIGKNITEAKEKAITFVFNNMSKI